MSNIDERVVAMKFQEGGFSSGVKGVLDALTSLKSGLKLDGATKGLEEVDAAGKRLDLSPVSGATDGISAKFLAMATIAVTALSTIATKAMQVGSQVISSLTVEPLKQGLEEYETNLNAIQTILANTQSKGTNLDDVNGALQELNTYSDKTIYNFSEMARNIGTFTAAGVDLDTSTNAIKGIANLAALSGSNSQQASTAMYQLSQALSTGKVSLMDWNSVVNAGMGGQVFQDAIKETARVNGVAVDDIIKKNGSFRDSLQTGWLTSDILTQTLSKFTGDLSAEQLQSMGYTKDQIAGIVQMATTASDAATKVKTMSQLLGTLKEAAGSGWAQSWQIVAGNFEEAKTMWTSVNNVLGGMIGASAKARNDLLQGWKDGGGRTELLSAFSSAFKALMAIIEPIKGAFSQIFPPITVGQLLSMTISLKLLADRLTLSAENADKVKHIFAGIFSVFYIVWEVIKGVAGVLRDLSGEMSGATNGIVDFVVGIADWLTNLRYAIKTGQGLTDFFAKVTEVATNGLDALKKFAAVIQSLFSSGVDAGASGMESSLDRIKARLEPLGSISTTLVAAWGSVSGALKKVWDFFQPLADYMSKFYGSLGKSISDGLSTMDFSATLDLVNTSLFGALIVIMKKFLKNGISLDVGGGFLSEAKKALEGVTGTLSAMQTNLKADTLLKIAGALGILTISVVALSMIDSGKLTSALAALTVMFVQLGGAMQVFSKIGSATSSAKLVLMAVGLTALAVAILLLTGAVKILSDMSWEELAKGLTAVTVLLLALSATAKLMSQNSGGLITAGIGMIAVAIAIKILASAVADFAGMSWEEMKKGLAGVSAVLLALGLFTRLADAGKAGLSQGVGLILISVALKILASAVADFAAMDYETLARGIGAITAALVIIAYTMNEMTGALLGAAALVIVSGALVVLTKVVKDMAGMTWDEIAHGLAVLAGSLIIIAGAMALMSGALLGAAALLIVAASLAILGPVLLAMANLSWAQIGSGLAMLAGVFVIFGLAGLVLTPVVLTLMGLGVAIALIGAGVLMAGIGVLAFSVGLTALSVAVGVAGTAIVGLVAAVIGLIPVAMKALGEGLIAFAAIIAESGPTLIAAMVTLITSLVTAIATTAPLVVNTLINLILMLLNVLVVNVPKFVDAGMKIIIGFLNGIGNNIGQVVTAGANIIINFLNGLAREVPRIASAATTLITTFISEIGNSAAKIADSAMSTVVTFVNSLANSIRTHTAEMNAAGGNLASAIIDGMTGGIRNGVGSVVTAAKNMAKDALNAAKNFLGIKSPSKEFYKVGTYSTEGAANGFDDGSANVSSSAEAVGANALDAMKKSLSGISDLAITGMDMTPTIRPVLDLSAIKKDSGLIDGFLAPSAVSPGVSYDKAASIAVDSRATQQAMATDAFGAQVVTTPYVFNQYNSSPEALREAEIYRQTKNALSRVREELPG